jgi:hypothetical protein
MMAADSSGESGAERKEPLPWAVAPIRHAYHDDSNRAHGVESARSRSLPRQFEGSTSYHQNFSFN